MPLSDVACRGAKPGPKPYRKADGGGLSLLIQPSGHLEKPMVLSRLT